MRAKSTGGGNTFRAPFLCPKTRLPMCSSLFSSNKSWFLFYLLAIAGFGGRLVWRHFEPKNMDLLADWAIGTVYRELEICQRTNSSATREISLAAFINKCDVNRALREQAEKLDSIGYKLADMTYSKTKENWEANFEASLATEVDFIRQVIAGDTAAGRKLSTIFPASSGSVFPADVASFVGHARPTFSGATLKSWLLRAELARGIALNSLAARLIHEPEVRLDRFQPALSVNVGQLATNGRLSGDVFLLHYSAEHQNITLTVNEKDIPLREGLGNWSRTYQTAGKRQLNTRFSLINPLTREVKTYEKSYILTIGE